MMLMKTSIKNGLIAFLILWSTGGFCRANVLEKFDVVVYGGTSGGFIAAIKVAMEGKRVALIEPSKYIGGMNVEGLGGTDIDNHASFQNSPAVKGLSLEFYRRIASAYGRLDAFEKMLSNKAKEPSLWCFEPHVAQRVIDSWLSEYNNIKLFKGERLAETENGVVLDSKRIVSISTESGNIYYGDVFIDATIEGDLLDRAGISTVVGRESNNAYNESFNGIQAQTSHGQFTVDVDPYMIPGNRFSGLIPTILNEEIGQAGEADHRIQAYCFRVCLTDNIDNKIPFRKPDNYNRSNYEIYLRYLRAGGKLYTPRARLPNRKTDLGAWHDLSHNLYGYNHEYPTGDYEAREEILKYHKEFTQGLFYFFVNDAEIEELDPTFQQEWARWGLAKDEFTDNDGWPRNFYVRDARRMVSDYVINENHIKKNGAIPVRDPVATAFWPPDVHSVRRLIKNGKAYNEGFVFGGNWWKPFGISYRALVPRRSECRNIITPTCPSSSHIAYGAIRIEFTFMA